MNFKSTLNEFPTHNTWVMVSGNVNGQYRPIMAHYECIAMGDKIIHEFKDYRDQKLYHCKCHPLEWTYVVAAEEVKPKAKAKAKAKQSNSPQITEDHFGVRAYNVLTGNNIFTLEDLCKKSPSELLALRGMGITTLDAILDELDCLGMELKEDEEGQ